ncbi:MAG TPA: Ppx/GppA phosphatase family protein [Micropepsaceae bacterium]|nr:Ppx/GppA phosphatase family protein [Micropepsaceae bacterium]
MPEQESRLDDGPEGQDALTAPAPHEAQTPAPTPAGNPARGRFKHVFAAIDLGTNNCRLLVARPMTEGFRVIDAFSRTVRLGEGVSRSGVLSEEAMGRTIAALKVCVAKMRRDGVTRHRAIATEACRAASNVNAFLSRVRRETGLAFEVIPAGEEARLCASGCAPLIDGNHRAALVFDIGGGSTEVIHVELPEERRDRPQIRAWASAPVGVVTLAERFAHEKTPNYADMVAHASTIIGEALSRASFSAPEEGRYHMLGTSGTVTTLAGVHLGLRKYDRSKVDGTWMTGADLRAVSDDLVARASNGGPMHPCVGADRADLVVPGCAILDAILNRWPADRVRVADRGLREGMLLGLMAKADKEGRRRRRRFRR